jgi:hypothetical protein
MRINLKRGLLRAWVVIAVAWIGLMGWSWDVFVPDYRYGSECWDRFAKWPDGSLILPSDIYNEAQPANQLPDIQVENRNLWRVQIRQKLSDCEAAAPLMHRVSLKVSDMWSSLKHSLPIIFLPPLALLIVGYIIGWVAQGFRRA